MRLDWDKLDVRMESCGYSRWPHGVAHSWTWTKRIIPDNDLWIFDVGRGVMEMIGEQANLRENTILWMRPGHFYEVDQDPENPIGHVYIHFELIRPDGSKYYPTIGEMPEVLECFNHAHWQAMGRNIVRLMNLGRPCITMSAIKATDCVSPEVLKVASSMLKSLLMGIDLCSAYTRPDEYTGNSNLLAIQAAEYLSESEDPFLKIQSVARHFSLSRNRFTKVFTDFWHISPQNYLIEQRLRRACRLLADTDWPLGKIAASLGYSDPFFFSRQFKDKTGLPPGAYRKQKQVQKNNIETME